MKKRFIFLTVLFFSISSQQGYPQSSATVDLSFEEALQKYLNKNLLTFGKNEIARERFLIQQMRDINEEMKSRVKNVSAVRDQYFVGLLNRLEELDDLRRRLSDYNSASLNAYIDQLDNRIRETIDQGEINYRRQKIFEDGIQVLYIAEEMLKLDPGAANQQLGQQIQASSRKLSNTFGDAEQSAAALPQFSGSGSATIWDLFTEWRRTNRLQYEARLTDIKVAKTRLLKNGTAMEKERMFKRELGSAVLAYNFRNYDLADRLFEEILRTYTFIKTLDDVYFYKGESNFQLDRYSAASEAYLGLVTKYPASAYSGRAYARLVMIADHFGDAAKVAEYYEKFQQNGIGNDPLADEIKFIAGVSAVSGGNYEQAVTLLNSLLPGSEFYLNGRYVLAQAYAGSRNFEDAKRVLQGIVDNYNTPPNFHYNVYLKLAYLNYQMADYPQAIRCLDEIGSEFAFYDKVLMAYAWNYYKMELGKDEDERNFDLARKYVEILTQEFSTSDYYLEAKTLLAYIYQVEKESQKAVAQYEYVYESGHTKNRSDASLRQSETIKTNLESLQSEQENALQKNEEGSYLMARDKYMMLQDSLMNLKYADLSPNSVALKQEISRLEAQLKQLEDLRVLAVQRNSPAMLEKIDDLHDRLSSELEDARDINTYSFLGMNYYDEHPLARKESLTEDKRNKILAMRNEALGQEKDLQNKISEIEGQVERARSAKNYKELVFLDIQKDRYQDLLKKYDLFHTLIYELNPSESEIQLDKWSNYGAFGIANVNFSVRVNDKNKMAYYSRQIDTINRILNNRKALLDYKIKLIDGEINYMTRKVRRQERLRERAELDRRFQESYFDTHTSEIQRSETQPPALNEEEETLPEDNNQ